MILILTGWYFSRATTGWIWMGIWSIWAAMTKYQTGWFINNRNFLLSPGGWEVQDQGMGLAAFW